MDETCKEEEEEGRIFKQTQSNTTHDASACKCKSVDPLLLKVIDDDEQG